MACSFVVDQKQVIFSRPPGDIDVFTQFDVSVGTEHGQAPVSPRGETVGREPVHAYVAAAGSVRQDDFPEVLEPWVFGMR